MLNQSLPNGSASRITVSQYGRLPLVSDILQQEGFSGLEKMVEAMGGDEEILKAQAKWAEYFNGNR